MGVILLDFRQEIHKTGGKELGSEFAFAGGFLSFLQQSLIPILLGVQLWRVVAQRGGGVASWSLDGGGEEMFCLNSRRGGWDNYFKRIFILFFLFFILFILLASLWLMA